jgi:ATP:corrinoid adenosyltransferase
VTEPENAQAERDREHAAAMRARQLERREERALRKQRGGLLIVLTEMTLVKHSYSAGYKAQRGVEF